MKKKKLKLLPLRAFLQHVLRNLVIGFLIIVLSLLIGMIGYHHFEQMDWVDAYVNASMILSGMGPFSMLQTEAGKIFAGTYALFSGIVFLVVIVILLAPVAHRFFHKFQIEDPK